MDLLCRYCAIPLRISVETSKASAELSEASKESKEIGRIVKGDWQNCQSSCEIIEVSAQSTYVLTVILVYTKAYSS